MKTHTYIHTVVPNPLKKKNKIKIQVNEVRIRIKKNIYIHTYILKYYFIEI